MKKISENATTKTTIYNRRTEMITNENKNADKVATKKTSVDGTKDSLKIASIPFTVEYVFEPGEIETVDNWIRGFSETPRELIEKAYPYGSLEFVEVTPPVCGERVYYIPKRLKGCFDYETIDGAYSLILDNGERVDAMVDEVEFYKDSYLPQYDIMWLLDRETTSRILSDPKNLHKTCACGFRIYATKYGLFLGKDECGYYDFYGHHWAPLYRMVMLGEDD